MQKIQNIWNKFSLFTLMINLQVKIRNRHFSYSLHVFSFKMYWPSSTNQFYVRIISEIESNIITSFRADYQFWSNRSVAVLYTSSMYWNILSILILCRLRLIFYRYSESFASRYSCLEKFSFLGFICIILMLLYVKIIFLY